MATEEDQMQDPTSQEEKILVSVRLRPLNQKELVKNDVSDWECINDTTVMYRSHLSISERSMYPSAYTFDRVFSADCSTKQVYEEGAKEVALSVVSGVNASVFAYGQTSSGKTYTMSGITDCTINDVYDYIDKHKEREFILKFSAMEIYNESVRDLLSADSSPLRLLDDPEKGIVVEKLTEKTLSDWNHFKELLSVCEAQRQIRETALNEVSSRSHQILRLTIESTAREFLATDKLSALTATVNFIDLAGSERASQSLSTRRGLKEGCHINRSLLTLGTVIRKLSKAKNGHIPFRDSKLTRILQSSLGGNARTAIICTMSPARIHVEQSRNTLLFASCAKGVTTNAQVNVVMSDKALVKHLQRELARMENELRNPVRTFVSFDTDMLLREKDLEIEKLKREVLELTEQLDLGRSQIDNLQRMVGEEKISIEHKPSPEEKLSKILVALQNQFPKLRVRNSWDSETLTPESPTLAQPSSQDSGVEASNISPRSTKHSRVGSDETLIQQTSPSQHHAHEEFDEPPYAYEAEIEKQPHAGEERIDGQANVDEEADEHPTENLVDHCKEVRCIEMENCSINRYADSDISECSPDRYEALNTPPPCAADNLGLTKAENEEDKVREVGDTSFMPKEESELGRPINFQTTPALHYNVSNERLSPKDLSRSTPASWFERDFTCRPQSVQTIPAVLPYGVDNIILSPNVSQAFASDATIFELGTKVAEASHSEEAKDFTTMDEANKMTSTHDKQIIHQPAEEREKNSTLSTKSVRDDALDPIQGHLATPLAWPLEFKRLQREIIELWHACNVSLGHRTYFFLLFRGYQKDCIYLEVELRRLLFIKESFSRGNKALEDGRTLSPTSSMRALNRERYKLSQQMQKRLSQEERENLFLRWGISLNTKHRRLQLAHRLWSETKDMEHIRESASVVGKLLGFVDMDLASKEMFGLNFALRPRSRKASRWKRSVLALSIL